MMLVALLLEVHCHCHSWCMSDTVLTHFRTWWWPQTLPRTSVSIWSRSVKSKNCPSVLMRKPPTNFSAPWRQSVAACRSRVAPRLSEIPLIKLLHISSWLMTHHVSRVECVNSDLVDQDTDRKSDLNSEWRSNDAMTCHDSHDSCIFPSSNLDEELCNIMDRRCRVAITLLMSTLAEAWRKARSAWRRFAPVISQGS